MTAFVRVDGIEALQNTFNNVAPRVARNLMRATVQQIATNIAKDVKINAPVLSGNLKKAIKAKRKKSHPDAPVSQVIVGQGKSEANDGFYWRFIEYGTKHIAPAPFVEPAKAKAQGDMSHMLREEFGKKLEKHLAREASRSAR